MTDLTILSKSGIFPADASITGINLNELIVGSTGSGKTFSTVIPRIINTYNSSLIIPISKPYVYELTKDLLQERGYEIEFISFIDPSRSTVSYDPLNYIFTDEDAMTLARNIILGYGEKNMSEDPFWSNSAVNFVAALIQLERLNSKHQGKKPSFKNVIDLMKMVIDDKTFEGEIFSSPLNRCFIEAEILYPNNHASRLWSSFTNLARRTSSCVYAEANVRVSAFSTETLYKAMNSLPPIDIHKIGNRRVALFIETSAQNSALEHFTNLLYADVFRVLFSDANMQPDLCLPTKVHIVFDDFACGSKIDGFARQISIFRAAGISVTLLLQSESQLTGLYGREDATTIINNCDTYVFFGNMDYQTCSTISVRLNCPVNKVLSMPLDKVVVCRRGSKPLVDDRYPVLEDKVFIKLNEDLRKRKEIKDYENCK